MGIPVPGQFMVKSWYSTGLCVFGCPVLIAKVGPPFPLGSSLSLCIALWGWVIPGNFPPM